ncbi:MAG: LuxR C-terminal-related transcriptional regulator [Leptolyngbyaceae cyanobacterium]
MLSARETEIWQLKRLGHTMVEIAQQLHISINTVKRHFQNINAKKIGR